MTCTGARHWPDSFPGIPQLPPAEIGAPAEFCDIFAATDRKFSERFSITNGLRMEAFVAGKKERCRERKIR